MKFNWNYIKGFLIIALVLFLYGFTNYRNLNQKITDIDIKFEDGENLFMNYEMVNKLLIQNDATPKNKSKSLIDLNELEKQVVSHPMVENATTYLTVNGQLMVSVKQRTPIGRIINKADSYYIDIQGKYMSLSENHSARVPIITGISTPKNTDDLFRLLSYIRGDNFLQKQIVGIHKMGKNEFNLMTRVGNHEIYLGNLDNLNEKFKNLKAFYSYAMKNGSIGTYKRLNLKYNNQVVGTKR
ncbi:MAG: hypothetical protein KUG51_00775 [Urechidicola sp.]|nr:hypothetical protein [Urechidicola sp.]